MMEDPSKATYDLGPKLQCPGAPLVTWLHFGHLATSLHLQPLAVSCSHMITIYELFTTLVARGGKKPYSE